MDPTTSLGATPVLSSYEDMANNVSLPDSAIIFSTEQGVACSPHSEEDAIEHKTAREDFFKALAEKYPGVNSFYSSKSEETKLHSQPLTLGEVRAVIKETFLKEQVAQLERDPFFATNPQLAALTARLIQANDAAAEAEAQLDQLGYPKEQLEQIIRESGKLLLDAGVTTALVGTAVHVVLAAAVGIVHAGISASTLGGPIMANLIPPSKPGVASPWPTIPEAATRAAVTGAITIAVETLARIDIRLAIVASFIAISADARAHICAWIDEKIAEQGFSFSLNKLSDQVGALFKECNINVGASYQRTKGAVIALQASEKEIATALTAAITRRAVVNGLLEEIQQFREIEEIPSKMNRMATSGARRIQDALQHHSARVSSDSHSSEIDSALQTMAAEREEIRILSQKIATTLPPWRRDLEQMILLLDKNIQTIEGSPDKLGSSSLMTGFRQEALQMKELAQKYLLVKGAALSEVAEESPEELMVAQADNVIRLSEEFNRDLQELSQLTATSLEAMEGFSKRNEKFLSQSMKLIVKAFESQLRETSKFAEELKDVSFLTQGRLQQFIALAKRNLETIEALAKKWSNMPFVKELKNRMKETIELAEKLEEAFTPLSRSRRSTDGDLPLIQPAMEEKVKAFFSAITTNLEKGSERIKELRQNLAAEKATVVRREEFSKNPYSYSGPGGARWKM